MRHVGSAKKAVVAVMAIVGASFVGVGSASADEVVARETVYVGPSRPLLWSGIFTAGVPYAASVVVGAESSNTADRALFIPIAGPWVDLSQRGGCPVSTSSCNGETLNKVLLVGDGIFQGIGALTIVSAFLFPRRGPYGHASNRDFHISPLSLRSGGGLLAVGTF